MQFESGVITMLARMAANGLSTAAQMAVVTGKEKSDFLQEAAEFYDEAQRTADLGEWAASMAPPPEDEPEDDGPPNLSVSPSSSETTQIKKR